VLAQGKYNGAPYCLPDFVSTTLLAYRKARLEAAGLPRRNEDPGRRCGRRPPRRLMEKKGMNGIRAARQAGRAVRRHHGLADHRAGPNLVVRRQRQGQSHENDGGGRRPVWTF